MAHKNKPFKAVSIDNIYRLDGRVPIAKAIPFGLQHVLAMFVSNLAPITIIAAAAQPALSTEQVGMLLQNAMFIAGIATMIQLYANRIQTAYRHGRELYICNHPLLHRFQLRVPHDARCRSYRRLNGGNTRPVRKAPCPLY